MNLSTSVKITPAILPSEGVAGTTDIEGAIVSLSGFEGLLAAVTFGVITATAVTSVKLQGGIEANLSDAADIANTEITVLDTDDDKTFYIDLFRPLSDYPYVRVVVDRGTANAVVASATYMQYGFGGARKMPTTHADGVSGTLAVSPELE